MREDNRYRPQIEPFFIQHIIPGFTCPTPYVRFRAYWVVEYFHGLKWQSENTFHAILRGCLNGLRDPSIPVRAAAATSMRQLIDDEKSHDTIRPHLRGTVMMIFCYIYLFTKSCFY